MGADENTWERCSTCKKGIAFGAKYFLCSVSTCKHPRTGLRFCSADCWDAHLPLARHREAWAEEAFAPKSGTPLASSPIPSPPAAQTAAQREPVRKIIEPRLAASAAPPAPASSQELDTLVVVSKVKQFIRDNSEYNTSQCCIDALTQKVAEAALKGIETARSAGRKTVMGRDIR